MKRLLLFSFGILFCGIVLPQKFKPEIISSGGGWLWNADVKMTYTIGEPVSGKISNGTTVLTQGFQQKWSVVPTPEPTPTPTPTPTPNPTSVSESSAGNFKINVYPNPSSDIINIQVQNGNLESAVIELIDLNGKVLFQQKIADKSTEKQISLSNYPESILFLKITTISGKPLGTFKIQKIN